MQNKIPSPHPVRDFFLRVSCPVMVGFVATPIWQIVLNHQNPAPSSEATVQAGNTVQIPSCQLVRPPETTQNFTLVIKDICEADLIKEIGRFGYKVIPSKITNKFKNNLPTVFGGFENSRDIEVGGKKIGKITETHLKLFKTLTPTDDSIVTTFTAEKNCQIAIYNPHTKVLKIVNLEEKKPLRVDDISILSGGLNIEFARYLNDIRFFVVEYES